MPYQKTKDGSLVNEVTLGDGYPLSNDLQPLKVGGEASPIEMSTSLPDDSDNGKVKVRGDLDITGTLKTKLSHDLIYDFDDEVNTLAQVKIDALIDSAPGALDTLNELAAALNDDASFSTTVTNSLALKAPLAAPAFTGNATFAGVTDFNDRVDINETSFPQLTFSDDGGTDKMNMGQSGEIFYFKTSDTANDIRFRRSDNTDVLNFDMSNARVGIGTASPSTALEVNGDITANELILSGTSAGISINSDSDTEIFFNTTNNANIKSQGSMYLLAAASQKLYLGANNTNAQVALDNGKLGIGTASPSEMLHLQGTGDVKILLEADTDNATETDNPEIIFSQDGGAVTGIAALTSNNTFYLANTFDDTTGALKLGTRNTARITIEGDGNVGIGTTSPTTTLDVEGTVSYKHTAFTTAGPTDNVDVSGTTVLEVDTSSNDVTIGGFTGGVQGQILYIVKTNTANIILLEHNEGGGSQDIFLTSGSDDRVVGYGGFTLYCNGTSWFSLSNPTGAADAG